MNDDNYRKSTYEEVRKYDTRRKKRRKITRNFKI